MLKTLGLIALAFILPVSVATFINWQEVRPYIIGDPLIAEGEMYCFSTGG